MQEAKAEGRRASTPGHKMPHPLLKRKSYGDRKASTNKLNVHEELRTSNLIWIGILVLALFAAVIIISLLCRYYFNIRRT
jgi:hypothetical protein